MIKRWLAIFSSLAYHISGYDNQAIQTYTAAVVEFNPVSIGDTFTNVAQVTTQAIEIIESDELNGADIVVLPEGIFNRQNTASYLPNTNDSYCDHENVDMVLRNISCAVRKANKYVVINLYVKINCEFDDQPFCSNQTDSTNLYNMAVVFDRRGDVVARYRKYNLFNEDGVQQTEMPDLITFATDFNVTFGICVCFDLMFDQPVINLVHKGVTNFIYPTMWFSEIPYLSATQYQQSWAYANNVNLLAANVNAPNIQCSGSGIYHGRSGALQVFISELPMRKILIANVPVDLPKNHLTASTERKNSESNNKLQKTRSISAQNIDSSPLDGDLFGTSKDKFSYAIDLGQDDLSDYTVKFLNFSTSSYQVGSVCNNAICCNYTVEIDDNGEHEGKFSYSYAISVFSGQRGHKPINDLFTGQDVCSLIACIEMNSKDSCGLRLPLQQVQNRYNFKKLFLETMLPITSMNVMPNTLTQELLPLKTTEFDYKLSEIQEQDKYVVTLNLNTPKSNLLTFALFSRNFDKDMFVKGTAMAEGIYIFVLCILSSFVWMMSNADRFYLFNIYKVNLMKFGSSQK